MFISGSLWRPRKLKINKFSCDAQEAIAREMQAITQQQGSQLNSAEKQTRDADVEVIVGLDEQKKASKLACSNRMCCIIVICIITVIVLALALGIGLGVGLRKKKWISISANVSWLQQFVSSCNPIKYLSWEFYPLLLQVRQCSSTFFRLAFMGYLWSYWTIKNIKTVRNLTGWKKYWVVAWDKADRWKFSLCDSSRSKCWSKSIFESTNSWHQNHKSGAHFFGLKNRISAIWVYGRTTCPILWPSYTNMSFSSPVIITSKKIDQKSRCSMFKCKNGKSIITRLS